MLLAMTLNDSHISDNTLFIDSLYHRQLDRE